MKQFNVTGMSCAACSARVEKAVSKLDGVTSCSVSLLTNSMGVEGTVSDDEIIKAVVDAGYGASLKGADKTAKTVSSEDSLKDTETPKLIKRLVSSIVILLMLMYVSMGHSMLGLPLPSFLDGNSMSIALVELTFTVIVMLINQKFFISGFKAVIHKAPNMDTLVAMGSAAAFIYSFVTLFLMADSMLIGDMSAAHGYLHNLYFESAAMILTLITIGKTLEARAKGKTTDALKGLMNLAPKTATVIRNGAEAVIPVEDVKKGEIFIVKPGENIPVDGKVIEGRSAVNEASITGESLPVDKEPGSEVTSATINQSGFLKCEAVRVGEDTTISQIIKLVSDAASSKAPIAKVADKVSGIFVPVVLGIALATFIIWIILGKDIGFSISRAIAVLVISCPCSLGLATPVAIMVGNGIGAKNGILFKTAASLEQAGKTDIVVLDKTGTITAGTPRVTDVFTAEGYTENDLFKYAYSLEKNSEHPLAKAVVSEAEARKIELKEVTDFEVLPGNGLKAKLDDVVIYGGNSKFIGSKAKIDNTVSEKAQKFAESGKTPLFFAREGEIIGIIAVADTVKDDSIEAIRELKEMGLHVVMLTGDNSRTAKAIGDIVKVDRVFADVLPGDKERIVSELKKSGSVIMIGDGINDAPALTSADIGMAIGAGSDIAIDAADVVLMKSTLKDAAAAIKLSRMTLTNIHENLFWAFFYNSIGIPVAAGALSFLGINLSPMLGAAAMSLSSFCVVSNALRLNTKNIYKAKLKKKANNVDINIEIKEIKTMEKTMGITGMMCMHCEARVKKALEAIEGVVEAKPNHETNSCVVTLSKEVADETLKSAVVEQGYEVTEIK